MRHYGDITQIHGDSVPLVDVITGGSPCQDLSVAGKRAGLAGERSGLFMEQIRIIKEMRNECIRQLQLRGSDIDCRDIRPRFMVWENVPGAFSSNKGEDFRAVLEETAKVADQDAVIPGPPKGKWTPAGCIMGDGWSIAWRVHDAQFWGVPQRKKRISLVADFGGECAPEILFECKSVSGDITESGKQGQGAAGDVGSGIEETGRAISFQERAGKPGGGKGILIQDEHTGALSTLNNQPVCYGVDAYNHKVSGDVAVTLNATSGDSPTHSGPSVMCYGISAYESNSMKSGNPHSGIYEAETARTLDLNGGSPACNQGGMAVVQGFDGFNLQKTDNISPTLMCQRVDTKNIPMVCEPTAVSIENHPADSRVKISEDGMVQTLSGRMGTGGGNVPMVMEEVAGTLDASYYKGCGERAGVERTVVMDAYCVGNGQLAQARISDKVGTLNCMHDQQAVLTYGLDRAAYNQGKNAKFNFSIERERIGAQVAKGPGAVCTSVDCLNGRGKSVNGTLSADACKSLNSGNVCRIDSIVRRLTPMECERLQGYLDHWTDIGDWVDSKGKKHKGDSDSPRYKALGNSIALPFWEWMAKRMVKYIEHEPTMASLFDGIGGFPLVYSRVGCKPIWCSEIEEFPIAVTKLRFPDDEEGINIENKD